MKILVLGAGVVGTAAAAYLARDGHEVTVVERHEQVARGTSYCNAGLVSPGDATAWASPAALKTFFRGIFNHNLGIRVRLQADPYFYRWSLRFLRQCTTPRLRANSLAKLRLALYARDCINELSAEAGIGYDERKRGIFYFIRSQESFDEGSANYSFLGEHGLPIEIVGRDRIAEIEPGLAAVKDKIAGGIYSRTDETGDCNKFTTALAAHCAANGAEIRTGETIVGIDTAGDEIAGVRTDKGAYKADIYVMALGNQSRGLARKIGVSLPIYPVKGYSLTIPVGNSKSPPTIGSVDEENLVAISPFGDRVRVTATAEISGYSKSHKPSDFAHMARIARENYPDGAEHDKAYMWAGLRPMTPTNLPVIGRKRHRNLYYDTGHGHIGWTMSHGSARILADVVGGRKPALALESIVD